MLRCYELNLLLDRNDGITYDSCVGWQKPLIGTSYFRHLLLASIDEDVTKPYFVDRFAISEIC